MRNDSIRAQGLEAHVNQHCMKHTLPWRYKNLEEWIEKGDEFGERMPILKLARLFQVSRPTMEKWLWVYKEQKGAE